MNGAEHPPTFTLHTPAVHVDVAWFVLHGRLHPPQFSSSSPVSETSQPLLSRFPSQLNHPAAHSYPHAPSEQLAFCVFAGIGDAQSFVHVPQWFVSLLRSVSQPAVAVQSVQLGAQL